MGNRASSGQDPLRRLRQERHCASDGESGHRRLELQPPRHGHSSLLNSPSDCPTIGPHLVLLKRRPGRGHRPEWEKRYGSETSGRPCPLSQGGGHGYRSSQRIGAGPGEANHSINELEQPGHRPSVPGHCIDSGPGRFTENTGELSTTSSTELASRRTERQPLW